jgi:hypothetical protein
LAWVANAVNNTESSTTTKSFAFADLSIPSS